MLSLPRYCTSPKCGRCDNTPHAGWRKLAVVKDRADAPKSVDMSFVREAASATAARAGHELFRLPIDMARCYRTLYRTMGWTQATGGSAMSDAPDAIRN